MKQLFHMFFIGMLALSFCVYAQDGVPLFTKDFTPEEFAQRRSQVYEAIGPNALSLVHGAP